MKLEVFNSQCIITHLIPNIFLLNKCEISGSDYYSSGWVASSIGHLIVALFVAALLMEGKPPSPTDSSRTCPTAVWSTRMTSSR